MALLLCLLLLLLLPTLVSCQGNKLALNYNNMTLSEDVRMQIYTTIDGHSAVTYYFEIADAFSVPLQIDGNLYTDCNQSNKCKYVSSLGTVVAIMMNPGSSTNYSFALNQQSYKFLEVLAEGCSQDLSSACRSINSSSLLFCICSGMGFCTQSDEQKKMWIEPVCSDIPPPPTNTPVDDDSYELSIFYGYGGPLSKALLIQRRVYGNLVEYVFFPNYSVVNTSVDAEPCYPYCFGYITAGQTLDVQVGDSVEAFTFTIVQVNLTQTDILYHGCSRSIADGQCGKDTLSSGYTACMCRGNLASCLFSAAMPSSCDETTGSTTKTTLSTSTARTTTTQTTTTSTTVTTTHSTTLSTTTLTTIPTTTTTMTTSHSTTTSTPEPWILHFFYGSDSGSYQNNVTIRRTYMDRMQGKFEITATNKLDVRVNTSACGSQCDMPLAVHQSMLISIPAFEFSLLETETDTLVETGPSMCVQDLSQSCRQDQSFDEYHCLCLNTDDACTSPKAFDPCTTTPTSAPSWTLRLYYGSSQSSLLNSVNITRSNLTEAGANLDIMTSNYQDVILNGDQQLPNYPCGTRCGPYLYVNNILVITIPGFEYYLNETEAETVIGLGSENCPQDISGCFGKFHPDTAAYHCLCLNTEDRCTISGYFQDCPADPKTTTSLKTTKSLTTTIQSNPKTTTSLKTTIILKTTTVSKPPTTSTKVTQKNEDTTMVTTTEVPNFPSLQNLSDSTIGQNNVTQVLNDTLTYSNSKGDLTSDQIDQISVILSRSANVTGLNETDSMLILTNMDNCLYAAYSDVSVDATMNMANVFQPMVQNTNATTISYLNGVNMGFHSKMVDCSSPVPDQGMMDNLTMFVAIENSPASHLNAIQIPMSSICAQAQTVSHVYFTMYRDRKLFLSPTITYRTYNNKVYEDNKNGRMAMPEGDARSKRDTTVKTKAPSPCDRQTSLAVDSPVMSGSMLADGGSQSISRLATEETVVNLQFNIDGLLPPLHGKFVVTYWDTNSLTWATTDQCKTEKKGYMVMATCPHLTDFTLIVDGALDDPSICDPTLSTVGYVVNGLSIMGLSFLFLIYICPFIPLVADSKFVEFVNGYAVARRDSISLSYTASLLLFYIVFTFFASQDVSGNACSTMAAISYALFIATIVMSIFKCLRTMARFFPGRTRNFFDFLQRAVVFDTISIITSFLLSLLLLLLTDFFERNDTFCWVRIDLIVFATVIPVSLLVLTATIATGLAAYRLFSTSMRVQRRGRHVNYNLGAKLANILILQFTLGMPWVLQYFTLALPKTTAWHYVFTIVLGSQGTVLALLFFYKRQRIFRSSRYAKKMASMQTQATVVSSNTSSKEN